MNYWIIWPVGIALWVALGWIEFGIIERKALNSTDPNKPTLSLFVYYITTKFPLATAYGMLLVGIFIGTLSTHFWWHWLPAGSVSAG